MRTLVGLCWSLRTLGTLWKTPPILLHKFRCRRLYGGCRMWHNGGRRCDWKRDELWWFERDEGNKKICRRRDEVGVSGMKFFLRGHVPGVAWARASFWSFRGCAGACLESRGCAGARLLLGFPSFSLGARACAWSHAGARLLL
ncbi:hypothetical protein L484_026333 [Morus notabilis]|uniref:Uncharacterized protein n=1 Tax=Morus notabilis TaxID=981085 RepID=W9R8E7_9ROSA|nr:hypothetical protein L484_026333 [Morus notabilis]